MKAIDQVVEEDFSVYNADCVDFAQSIPDNSIDLSIYSPPFTSLYIYSNSERDMGNCESDEEFFENYKFLIREKLRITRPGRISAVHTKVVVNYKGRDGNAGWRDFPGDVIRAHIAEGWVYHCEIIIWKCPVIERARTNSQRLLYKQLCQDSTYSGVGIPEKVLIFRKPPEDSNECVPVENEKSDFPLDDWQEIASPVWPVTDEGFLLTQEWPVWFDIRQTNVLNAKGAKSDKDEKHICPLQLDVIHRLMRLYSNPGEVVFDPFTGIGSTGHVALKMGRRFIGTELKPEYFNQAVKSIREGRVSATDMFGDIHQ